MAETPRSGKKYWRSLEELADTPQFREFVAREFPQQAEGWNDPVERRRFIKLMGASLALCRFDWLCFSAAGEDRSLRHPAGRSRSGQTAVFATAAPMCGVGTPILVRSNDGRPTKIEGNPDHPNNKPGDFPPNDPLRDPRGSSATDIFTQAAILDLYDPDRSQTITHREDIRTWTILWARCERRSTSNVRSRARVCWFLTETIISPSLGAQMNELLRAFPQAKWHQYEPANGDNRRAQAL